MEGICVSLAAQLFYYLFTSITFINSPAISGYLSTSINDSYLFYDGRFYCFIILFYCFWIYFSYALTKIIHIQNAVVYSINDLPFALIKPIWLTPLMLILLILLLGLVSMYIIKKQRKWLHLTICFSFLTLSCWLIQDALHRSKKRVCFFHHYKTTHSTIIHNRSSISFYNRQPIKQIKKKQDNYLSYHRVKDRQYFQLEAQNPIHPIFHYLDSTERNRILFINMIDHYDTSRFMDDTWLIIHNSQNIYGVTQAFISVGSIIYDGQSDKASEQILIDWASTNHIELIDISKVGLKK